MNSLAEVAVAIPSYGRPHNLLTTDQFSAALLKRTSVVVLETQYDAYMAGDAGRLGVRVCLLPHDMPLGLAPARQWILSTATAPVVILMDDDLTFFRRDKDLHLHIATQLDVDDMVLEILKWMPEYAMVGVSMRVFNNHKKEPFLPSQKLIRCWAVHTPSFKEMGVRIDPWPSFIGDDHYLNLSFLSHGFKTGQICGWAQSDRGQGSSGGCKDAAVYSKRGNYDAHVHFLAEKFPGVVHITGPSPKDRAGLGPGLLDFRVAWKQAGAMKRQGIRSFTDV